MSAINPIQEKIKLATEWMRMYFILFLTDISGSATLTVRIIREQSTRGEIILLFIGIIIAVGLLFRMFMTNSKINNFINRLNQNN